MLNSSAMMKKFDFTVFLALLCLVVQAKTTYIPTYFSRILMVEDGRMDSAMNHRQMLEMSSGDGLVTCTVVQQVVSEELIRSIKSAKRTAGWLSAMSALAEGGATFSQVQLYRGRRAGGYIGGALAGQAVSDELAASSYDAYGAADEMKTLMVDLFVRNNSDKEMMVTDMDRGLVWFVLPGQEALLPLAKAEECHYRLSSCAPLDENVKYLNVSADSHLEKYTIAMETDNFWYVPLTEKTKLTLGLDSPQTDGYIRIDRESFRLSTLTDDEFKQMKEQGKK